jgi:hypothetical protein
LQDHTIAYEQRKPDLAKGSLKNYQYDTAAERFYIHFHIISLLILLTYKPRAEAEEEFFAKAGKSAGS